MAPPPLNGQITLVLGAGISARIVPQWDDFTLDVVREIAGLIRRPVDQFPGIRPNERGDLVLSSAHPLANEALLEHCWQELRRHYIERDRGEKYGTKHIVDVTAESRRTFAEVLRLCLYRDNAVHRTAAAARGRNATLDAVVRALLGPDADRICTVITFNIDDWLERCLHAAHADVRGKPWADSFFTISHPTWGPVRFGGPRGTGRRVPLYHLHGLLTSEESVADEVFSAPRVAKRRAPIDAPNSLVFTEEQYWSVTATPSGFANHVMQSALQHSHCIFLGLSMRDRNLLRWLGMRALEHERTWADRAHLHFHEAAETVTQADGWRTGALKQHVWVTRDPDPLLRAALSDRGVFTLEADHTDPAAIDAAFRSVKLLS